MEIAAIDARLAEDGTAAGPCEADRRLTEPDALAWAPLVRMTLSSAGATVAAASVVWLALGGCADFGADLRPPQTEELLESGETRVTLTLVDRGGFPDRIVDYRIQAHGAYGEREVLGGQAQVQHVAHAARATALPSGLVAVALHDDLCLLDAAGTVTCIDVASADGGVRTMGAVNEALLWRADDPEAEPSARAHARAALEGGTRRPR